MAFPVIGGTQVSGYNIDNSLRFNRDDNAYLEKTFSGSPTSTKICTISFWLKLADPSNTDAKAIFSAIKSGVNEDVIKFGGLNSGLLGYIEFVLNNTSDGALAVGDGSSLNFFRDPSAWYHFVIAFDTSQGTASNRIKFYQNGTLLQTESRIEGGSVIADIPITQNYDLGFLTASKHQIGMNVESSNSEPFDGYLSEFYFIDGQQLAPTEFGETSDNGVWIPKNYTGSYGNYGFKLEFKQLGTAADATSIGADTSGNDNHFSQTNVTPALDRTVDTPTNNFCTFIPLKERPGEGYATFSEGNCKATGTSLFAYSSFVLPSSGKWYAEFKATAGTSTAYVALLDVDDYTTDGNTNRLFYRNDGQKDTGSGASSYGDSWTTNDIISIAANVDDSEVTFYKNGVAQDSGTAISQTCANQYIIVATAGGWTFEANFGNAPFSISSGNADANGYGNFEYAPPTNYYSLCSKNLAEYG